MAITDEGDQFDQSDYPLVFSCLHLRYRADAPFEVLAADAVMQVGVDADGLRAFLKERLAGYKVPKYITVVHEPLPKNASEKLHKLKVKDWFLAQQG